MAKPDLYTETDFAKFYDWAWSDFDSDLEWYLNLARHHGHPILEIACGTGRVALPLARAGFEVLGLDLSEPMLTLARRKIESEPEDVRASLLFKQADMRHFHLDRSFPCVFVPNASLFHLHDSMALGECITCLFKHTRAGGVLTIDLVSPHKMPNQEVGVLHLVREGINPLTGCMTKEYNRKLKIDRERQIVCAEHIYIEQDQMEEKRYEFTQDYRWIEEKEGLCLLSQAGFTELSTFGNYEGSSFSEDSRRLIFLARKPSDGDS